jgi:single-stranded-DNA-specific exonuclease
MSMHKIWSLRPPGDEAIINSLKSQLGVDEFIANLLFNRNITTFEDARSFFRPSLQDVHDPFLMKDMDKAIDRISEALFNKQKILVYGDYDVDGTTSVATVWSFLTDLGIECLMYLPDRYKEGYGISMQGVQHAADQGCNLMIALDCGIKAIEQIDKANSLGVDVIICDHHEPGDVLPKAMAVLDPKRKDCDYPFSGLSGCGVGFKMLHALCIQQSLDLNRLWPYLDLLTISIGADIVPMVDENRIFARYGLKLLLSNPRPGVQAIFETAGFRKSTITISDVVFILAPRINAAGRIASAKDAVELLVAKDYAQAVQLSQQVEQSNTERRAFDKDFTLKAMEQLAEDEFLQDSVSTVVRGDDWHKGVIGIVASRLIEQKYRPTIVFTESKGVLSGSARSVEGIDVHELLHKCSDLLIQYGGHAMAAGMTMKPENYQAFREKFDAEVKKVLGPETLIPKIKIDEEIALDHISDSNYKIIRQFAPFGPGNMKPIFLTQNLMDNNSRVVGADKTHLKLGVKETITNHSKDGIAFGMASHYDSISKGDPFDIVYTLEENEWNGKTSIQLNVLDIKSGVASEAQLRQGLEE